MDNKKEKQKNIFQKILEIIKTMASKPSGLIGLTILIFHVILAITSPLYVPNKDTIKSIAKIHGIDKKASIILITISSVLPPTKPQKIPNAPPHNRAINDPKNVTVSAVLPPKMVLVNTSLPRLSVPNQNSDDGGVSIKVGSIAL